MIESAFVAARASERLETWRRAMSLHVIELHCTAERAVLVERFRARALGSDRHPGHDEANADALDHEFVPRLLGGDDALIPGTDGALVVDTTYPDRLDFPAITESLRRLLWPHPDHIPDR